METIVVETMLKCLTKSGQNYTMKKYGYHSINWLHIVLCLVEHGQSQDSIDINIPYSSLDYLIVVSCKTRGYIERVKHRGV